MLIASLGPQEAFRAAPLKRSVELEKAGRYAVIHWKQIDEFNEPNWEKVVGTRGRLRFSGAARRGAVFGYIRDGELFDYKWLYVCDSNKVTHFSQVNGPESNVVELEGTRSATK